VQDVPFGRMTAKGKTLYLHVFDWPQGSLELNGLPGRVSAVKLLAGGQPVKFTQSSSGVRLDLSGLTAGDHATVLAISLR
jgi:alpha-L-fucosidase